MTITILGQHISLIRPALIRKPQTSNPRWRTQRRGKPKTREIGCAEFLRLCLDYEYKLSEPKYWMK